MGLLDQDLLVMDQVTNFLSNDFAIRDANGAEVGSIITQGSTLRRMFLGSRQLMIHDEQGRPVVMLDDVMTWGRDRFELALPNGQPIAHLVKQFTFFSRRISLELTTGEYLEVQGHFFDHDFEVVTADGRLAARVARRWPGLAAGLLGHNRFVVELAPGLPEHLRVTVIGAVVALDLIRAKEKQAATSSN